MGDQGEGGWNEERRRASKIRRRALVGYEVGVGGERGGAPLSGEDGAQNGLWVGMGSSQHLFPVGHKSVVVVLRAPCVIGVDRLSTCCASSPAQRERECTS